MLQMKMNDNKNIPHARRRTVCVETTNPNVFDIVLSPLLSWRQIDFYFTSCIIDLRIWTYLK